MASIKLLTTTDVAKTLGVNESRVRQLCLEGRLGEKVGGRWIFTTDDVERFQNIPRPAGKRRLA